jgi:DNA repair protein RadA/Sms
VFVTAAGGIRVTETAADVAVIGAIYSSYKNKAINPSQTLPLTGQGLSQNIKNNKEKWIPPVLVGEVSLLGEVRGVKQMNKRKIESERMGRRLVEMERIEELKKA